MATSEHAVTAEASYDPAVVTQFLDEAATAVGTLAREAAAVAGLFRSFDLKSGNERLAVLPAELRNFIVMVNVVDRQLGIDPGQLTVDGIAPEEQLTRLGGWLESLVEAQRNADALTVADILEYDLEPFLSAWSAILAAPAGRAAAEQPAGR